MRVRGRAVDAGGQLRMSTDGPVWTLEFYEESGREPVLDFLRGLDEVKE